MLLAPLVILVTLPGADRVFFSRRAGAGPLIGQGLCG